MDKINKLKKKKEGRREEGRKQPKCLSMDEWIKKVVSPLKSQETRGSPRKRGNSLPRRSISAVDLKRLLPARVAAPRKRKSSKSYPRKIRMNISLVEHNLQRYFPTHPL